MSRTASPAEADPVLSKAKPAPSDLTIDGLFLLVSVAVCAVTAWIGVVHTFRYGHDIMVILNGAWRVINGQRPQVDFSASGFGPVPFLLYATGLRLAHFGVEGIGYANALLGFLVGLWSYRIGIARMPRVLAALTSISLILLVVSPYPIGFSRAWLGHAMSYNRQGYALLGLMMLEAFQAVRQCRPPQRFLGGVSTGAACGLLLFLKASFGLVGLALAFLSLLVFVPRRSRILGLLAGFGLVCLSLLAYQRFDLPAIWRDLSIAAAARAGAVTLWNLEWNTWDHLSEVLALLLLAAVISWDRFRHHEALLLTLRPLLLAVVVYGAGVLLLSTNAQNDGFPLNGVMAMILVAGVWEPGSKTSAGPYEAALLALALTAFLPQALNDQTGFVRGVIQARKSPPANVVTRFDAPVLSKLMLFDVEDPQDWERRSNGNLYVATLNEGFDLVRRNSTAAETVQDMDAFDPFAYALQRKPARGGVVALSYQNSFDDLHKHSPEWLYGSADVLLIPLYSSAPQQAEEAILRNYEADVLKNFRLCAQSPHWKLYKRADSGFGCPARSVAGY